MCLISSLAIVQVFENCDGIFSFKKISLCMERKGRNQAR